MKGFLATLVISLVSWEIVIAQRVRVKSQIKEIESRLTALEDNEWTLLFSAKNGSGKPVLKSWLEKEAINIEDTNADVYKSPLAEEWGRKPIAQVKLEVLTDGESMAYFIFNGQATTKSTFMATDRILASSSGNLVGKIKDYCKINAAGKGACSSITSWLLVVDTGEVGDCEWATNNGPRPIFLYCDKTPGPCALQSDSQKTGDTFQISVKFA